MKAVVLLSGGLDSSTTAYLARSEGYEICAVSFDYGQRHWRELKSATRIAQMVGAIEHRIVRFDLRQWGGGSALTSSLELPLDRSTDEMGEGIPVTYVPARNTIFLAFGLSYAEAVGAELVYIGANAIDYSGYPDCRPDYLTAMQTVFTLGTKAGREGRPIRLEFPLVEMTKPEIVLLGDRLGVPWEKTYSCYTGAELSCGHCDSCLLRIAAFEAAGRADPLTYAG
ncbi:MAG: 7-cyano-7-deazaguanine synthase QueC [Gemmatimonadaceae bacterium]|nr:7-cyano-7-deazaguanine synthase QueC [Gloeobacterales cyanobacterium ES-bin-141]